MRRLIATLLGAALVASGLAACETTAPPVSQTPPIRATFYYGWFPEAWTQQGIYPYSNYTPTRGFYDTNNVVAAQIAEMQYAGLTAGIASWWGQGTKTDGRIPNLLSAASGTGFQWALYYEQEGTTDPTPAVIASDLDYIKTHYANDPSYLHVNGKPVIFAFGGGTDNCAMADRWRNADPNRAFYVDLKVFSGYKTCANQPDSWHQYGPSSAIDNQAGYSSTVSPGFWKKGEASPRLVRDPARFAQNVRSMVASKAPWQLITTYNEWGEGTSIEPSTAFGTTYLDILHNQLVGTTTTTTGGPSSTTSTSPTTSPSTTTTSSSSTSTTTSSSTSTTVTSPTSTSTTTTTVPTTSSVCGNAGTPKLHQKVVVFSFENRTWSGVGGTQFQSIPYFNGLAKQCSTFSNDTEPDTGQNSATQYVGQWQGSTANTVRNDCQPSGSCQSTADNIGRQVRAAGKTVRSYVEGASSTCSAGGNAAKHIPALYFRAPGDAAACNAEVRPYSQFNPNSLADFSFITPTLCNDGHDCGNSTVSTWAAKNVQPVLDSADYKAGNVTVFIWWDEDFPVPNMQIGLHAKAGVKNTAIDYGSTLRAWETMLNVPLLAHAANAVDLRPLAGI
jgi:hypothetical protein